MALPRVFRCSDRDTDLGTPIYWLARKNTLQRTETTRAYRRAALARCLSGALLNVLSPAPTWGGGGGGGGAVPGAAGSVRPGHCPSAS